MPAFSLRSRSPDGAATDCGDNIYSCILLLIYWPWKDERLSWLSWLTYRPSGRFTHISGHPSAVGRAQDSETSPVKDQRSAAAPRNQPIVAGLLITIIGPITCITRNYFLRLHLLLRQVANVRTRLNTAFQFVDVSTWMSHVQMLCYLDGIGRWQQKLHHHHHHHHVRLLWNRQNTIYTTAHDIE